jgi:hypothetical protein
MSGKQPSCPRNLLILMLQRTDIIRAGVRTGEPPLSARSKRRDRSSGNA